MTTSPASTSHRIAFARFGLSMRDSVTTASHVGVGTIGELTEHFATIVWADGQVTTEANIDLVKVVRRYGFTVTMKRNAKSTSFTITDASGDVVATKRSASTGYAYYVISVHVSTTTGIVWVSVVKRTNNPKVAARETVGFPNRVVLSDQSTGEQAWVIAA